MRERKSGRVTTRSTFAAMETGITGVHKYRSLRLEKTNMRVHCYGREIANNILSGTYASSGRKNAHTAEICVNFTGQTRFPCACATHVHACVHTRAWHAWARCHTDRDTIYEPAAHEMDSRCIAREPRISTRKLIFRPLMRKIFLNPLAYFRKNTDV